MDSPQRRNKESVILAHARLQGQLLMLMMAAASGYEDGDEREQRKRLAEDAQDVVDAAIALRRAVLLGGDVPDG